MDEIKDRRGFWDGVLDEVRERVTEGQYRTWFSKARCIEARPDGVVVGVENPFILEWVRGNYSELLEECIAALLGGDCPPLSFTVVEGPREALAVAEAAASSTPSALTTPSLAERPTSRPTAPSRPRHDALRLNGDYTFDHFVVGPSNRLSHAASLAVVDQPGEVYNPLFVHGGLGLGKTHLLQAICHELLQRDPTRRILYLPCEQFINQFISALERNTIDAFRERYRRLDVLVIDDIHFLANKDHSQEEFFHTFNALYNEKRQIILSSDSPPAEIPQIEERLVSRFAWGFVAKIEQPTYETRLAIIRKKAQRSHSDLPDEVAEYLAGSMGTLSIREIEGLVTRLLGSARLMKCAIDLETARDLLKGEIRDNRSRVTIEQVVSEICETYGVRLSDLQSKKRHQSITQPRQAAMHLLRRFTTMSLSEIGGFFGGRDHTTVIYALDKVKKRLETDPEFRALLEELVRRLER